MCSVVHGRWREAKAIKASFEDELCVSLNDALVFFLLRLDESQCKSVAHEAVALLKLGWLALKVRSLKLKTWAWIFWFVFLFDLGFGRSIWSSFCSAWTSPNAKVSPTKL